jgi:hypothetical protein
VRLISASLCLGLACRLTVLFRASQKACENKFEEGCKQLALFRESLGAVAGDGSVASERRQRLAEAGVTGGGEGAAATSESSKE